MNYEIEGRQFEVIKDVRLTPGKVLRSGDVFARLGPADAIRQEQLQTELLRARGFPVPTVLSSGDYDAEQRYFCEASLGDRTFHEQFKDDFRSTGAVSDETFARYLAVTKQYQTTQLKPNNHSAISSANFVESLLPDQWEIHTYQYFGYDVDRYRTVKQAVTDKLAGAAMGILQYDLNPYNMLDGGVIDFELSGFGPIGYDTLTSVRWGGTWFTNYPSRYPQAYVVSPEQIARHDQLVHDLAANAGVDDPSQYREEFVLLKTAWALHEPEDVDPTWPADKIGFRHFRAELLNRAVEAYAQGLPIPISTFADVPGAELT